ncbi:ABC transporter substrate-binding protein [Alicyclobacillus sp. SO9]|uniref:substrate-binding periplasmic protein n=1 Tax=Alicyclobacillus sp. SO9 TaxID=2665646 RepID=UPI0018E8966E|nr:transporter substrate-binding domain-containing protein [Alicyclobacillus sp. SO9]QQE79038.1 amino acid ABC transporter substrate-binding protein [Alicyclobacillus sp. SO9]
MRPLSKLSIPVLIGAVSVAALTGCGAKSTTGGGSTGNSSGGNQSTSSTPNKNTLLGKVMSTHTLTIAESAYAPEDFQDPKTKKWTGYDIDILKGFAKTLGAKLKVDSMPFASSIQAVGSKRADITIDIYYNKKRAKVLSFSRPMLNYADVIAVNSKNPKVSSPTVAALKGKKIAVVQGSAEVAEAKKIPNAKIKTYSTVAESFLALSQGRVAADLQPSTDPAWAVHKNSHLKVKILGDVPSSISPSIQSLRGYYGVPKGTYSQSFLKKLNTYLKKIAANGTEQKILDKYGLKSSVFLKGIAQAPNTYS